MCNPICITMLVQLHVIRLSTKPSDQRYNAGAQLNLFLFLNKTYVVGTQKNRLDETVLLSTKKMFKLIDKKNIVVLR